MTACQNSLGLRSRVPGLITERVILRYRFSPTSELVRLVGGNEDVTQHRLRMPRYIRAPSSGSTKGRCPPGEQEQKILRCRFDPLAPLHRLLFEGYRVRILGSIPILSSVGGDASGSGIADAFLFGIAGELQANGED